MCSEMERGILLANTFSPQMLGSGVEVRIVELCLEDAIKLLQEEDFVSVVSHEETAILLTKMIGREVKFNRVNVTLLKGDRLIAIVPVFRAEKAREMTREEVLASKWRAFKVACQ